MSKKSPKMSLVTKGLTRCPALSDLGAQEVRTVCKPTNENMLSSHWWQFFRTKNGQNTT